MSVKRVRPDHHNRAELERLGKAAVNTLAHLKPGDVLLLEARMDRAGVLHAQAPRVQKTFDFDQDEANGQPDLTAVVP